MKYVMIAGPDKLGISSFAKFIISYLGSTYTVGEIHSLMSQENIDSYFKDFINKFGKGILTYYIKKGTGLTPNEYIPSFLQEGIDIIVWFDLYSDLSNVKIVKDECNELKIIIEEWYKFIRAR